ncbi:coiled-coil domain-containing protein 15 [Nematostella vectensis]|uniref:coiled-coil domain-containing protein 15 n=1 Tax=Nematostella vectensis TaxID=45351 RepID=UPI002077167E|nr:coiled-coil domain-containing protein 15 [Nematostella vectensis]
MASLTAVVCRAAYPDHTAVSRSSIAAKTSKKKIKSKGHLVHRSSGIPPFSAWVEPVRSYEPQAAMENARSAERRMQYMIHARQERLKEFQEGVKCRVKEMERIKRDEQMGNTYKAIEFERNVVHQSSFPKKASLPKRDTCVYRDDSDLTIKKPITRGSVIHDHEAVGKANRMLEEHADKIKTSAQYARGILKSKCLPIDEQQRQALPGGLWSVSPSRDHGSVRQEVIDDQRQEGNQPPSGLSNTKGEGRAEHSGDYWIGDNEIVDTSLSVIDEKEEAEPEVPQEEELPSWIAGQENVTVFRKQSTIGKQQPKRVHFAGARVLNDCRDSEKDAQIRSNFMINRQSIERFLKPGKVLEEKKCQSKNQMAVYRRLFMDMEREQVRENIRMKEHRKRMAEVKVEKEIQRLEVERRDKLEMIAQEAEKVEPSDTEQEEIAYQRVIQQRHEKLQKSKETERFIDALRAMIKEKMGKKGVRLPPLCACGPTIWDASPETCANNCVFYRNPKAYAKALSSLLGSIGS